MSSILPFQSTFSPNHNPILAKTFYKFTSIVHKQPHLNKSQYLIQLPIKSQNSSSPIKSPKTNTFIKKDILNSKYSINLPLRSRSQSNKILNNQDIKIYYYNNNTKLKKYNSFSKNFNSQLQEKQWQDKMEEIKKNNILKELSALSNKIELLPTVKHISFNNSSKNLDNNLNKLNNNNNYNSNIPLKKIRYPFLYKNGGLFNKFYTSIYNPKNKANSGVLVFEPSPSMKVYKKDKINLEYIFMNYKANLNKDYKGNKIESYQMKVSSSLKKNNGYHLKRAPIKMKTE